MGMGCDVFIEPSSQHQTNDEPPEAKYQTRLLSTTNLANSIQVYSYDTFHNTNHLVELVKVLATHFISMMFQSKTLKK